MLGAYLNVAFRGVCPHLLGTLITHHGFRACKNKLYPFDVIRPFLLYHFKSTALKRLPFDSLASGRHPSRLNTEDVNLETPTASPTNSSS